MSVDSLFWILQSNDTGYPSGGYAHSFGLEELVRVGIVSNEADLERFIARQIIPNLLKFEIPFFAQALKAAKRVDVDVLGELDRELDAWRIPPELRDAGRRIGSQRLALLCELDASPLALQLRQNSPRCHHLVVTAVELRNAEPSAAARAFAYQAVVAATSASMKLMRIGQTACQRILRSSLESLDEAIEAALSTEPKGHFNPMLEIASMKHAYSHERLFIS